MCHFPGVFLETWLSGIPYGYWLFFLAMPVTCGQKFLSQGLNLLHSKWPKPLQWQCWILNLLHHKRTSLTTLFHILYSCSFAEGFCLFFFFFGIFRAAPMECGGSQARGLIGGVVPAYATATVSPDLSRVCNLHHSSWQCQILNPMSEARDWTCNLMVPS